MDKIQKFLAQLTKRERQLMLRVFKDIKSLNLKGYDITALKGYKGVFRIRKGKIRIIFTKQKSGGVIVNIDYRKDAYK